MTKSFEKINQKSSWKLKLLEKNIHNVFGNINSTILNLKYCRYGNYCTGGNSFLPKMDWPLKTEKPIVIKNALTSSDSKEISNHMQELIDTNHVQSVPGENNQFVIDKTWSRFSKILIKLFDGPLGVQLKKMYESEFRVQWIDSYRTYPGLRKSSWLWHMDNSPPFHIKGLVYLTPCDTENGATQILEPAFSKVLNQKGYMGISSTSRLEDLSEFNDGVSVNKLIVPLKMEAGDAVLFNSNVLHRGGEVIESYRDVLSFFILPSRINWREHLANEGKHLDITGGFPTDPFIAERRYMDA